MIEFTVAIQSKAGIFSNPTYNPEIPKKDAQIPITFNVLTFQEISVQRLK